MAKFVYIFKANDTNWGKETEKIKKILGHIHRQPYLKASSHEFLWCSTSEGLTIDRWNMETGKFSNKENQFTFRLQVDENSVRLTPDSVASRTVWFFKDENQIIISSSQRTIISLLSNFHLNEQAISWMICTGCTGPNSWDQRIRPVMPSTEIVLSKRSAEITTEALPHFSNKKSLEDVFQSVFSSFKPQRHLGITLSGGWDSRAVACQLVQQKVKPTAYTWGIASSIDLPETDANVAQKVAEALKLPFKFLAHEAGQETGFLATFIKESEGRIDHVNSFSDGFSFWRQLNSEKVSTVARADEAFGWIQVSNDQDTRISLDLNLPADYVNIREVFNLTNLPEPSWPNSFAKKTNESLASWRDRLYRIYRVPYILAALQDPMLSFVEIINPLLDSRFVSWAMHQSDKDRTNKRAYKSVVKKWLSQVPVAKVPSIPEVDQLLSKPEIVEEIKTQLMKQNSYFNFNDSTLNYLLNGLNPKAFVHLENIWVRTLKSFLPFKLKKWIRNRISGYKMGSNRIAFRAYIVSKMMETITSDLK